VAYEVIGTGDPAVVFAPADGERHQWPAQAAYLAQSHTVITIDPPGPAGTDPVAELVAVLDACGATPAGTWPSPPSCASSGPACRCTGWPSTR
jgi:pimeloyl-ACP methyl ester carboxylesterase